VPSTTTLPNQEMMIQTQRPKVVKRGEKRNPPSLKRTEETNNKSDKESKNGKGEGETK